AAGSVGAGFSRSRAAKRHVQPQWRLRRRDRLKPAPTFPRDCSILRDLRRCLMVRLRWAKVVFFIGLLMFVGWVAMAQQQRRVDDAALTEAGKTGEDWITYNMNWSEQRYSPLTQINASNVSRLGVAWSYDIPAAAGNPQNRQEATPLVFNGVLYSITPWSVV